MQHHHDISCQQGHGVATRWRRRHEDFPPVHASGSEINSMMQFPARNTILHWNS